jgi:DNA integrity scanning protein DisA with diadenylate cyclase activity
MYYQELKGKKEFYELIKVIQPKEYKKLLKSSFSNEVFYEIIYSIKKYLMLESPKLSFEILKNLVQVERFDMVVMFLEEKEEIILKEIFSFLEKSNDLENNLVFSLKKNFNL